MSGSVAGLLGALPVEMSGCNELSIFLDDAKRQRILASLFDQCYADCAAAVIFDTRRACCARTPVLARLFPDAKVIALVRNLPCVVDSIERLVRDTPSARHRSSDTAPTAPCTRANGVAGVDGMAGLHTVRGRVHTEPRQTLLPPDLFQRFANDAS